MDTQSPPPVAETSAIARVLAGAVLISFSGVFVKWADVSPTVSAFYRVFFGGLLLLFLVLLRRERLWQGAGPLGLTILCGLFFSLDLFTWHRSIQTVGPGLATILANFQVFFLGAAGLFFLGEAVGPSLVVAAPLAIVGLFLIFGIDWAGLDSTYKAGVLFGLSAAAFYAAYTMTLRRLQARPGALTPFANLTWVSLVSAGSLGIAAWTGGDSFAIADLKTLSSLLALGIVCQVLGWVVIASALPRLRASVAGLLLLLQPALAFVWDVLFFARPTTWVNAMGVAITLFAIYAGAMGRSR